MTTIKKRATTRPAGITVYITPTCTNCPKTLHLLRHHQIPHRVVDLTKDNTAYTYVTQNLGYKQAPVTVVSDGKEQVSWSGHNPDMIHDHNLTRYRPAHEDRMKQAHANTTAAIRASGLGGRSTGPHLHFVGEYGPELKNYGDGEPV
jgi:glutaredoxin-like protein NrdH